MSIKSIPTFIMMCGIPGSGKSEKAEELAKEYDAEIFASDKIRAELTGNENNQLNNEEVFKELHSRIKKSLLQGKNCIYDATNIHYKLRMRFLQYINYIYCNKYCVVVATPFKECIKRNIERNRVVPEEVIEKMYRNFDIPYWYEGWDNIWIEYSDDSKDSLGQPKDWLAVVSKFNQENHNHKLSLGTHCLHTYYCVNELVNMVNEELSLSAMIHDNGKCFTKSYKSDVQVKEAHYYNHENVGSYDSLFYDIPADHLSVAALVRWHMQPYSWEKNENYKLHEKYLKLWGRVFYAEIMLLHQADVMAH